MKLIIRHELLKSGGRNEIEILEFCWASEDGSPSVLGKFNFPFRPTWAVILWQPP